MRRQIEPPGVVPESILKSDRLTVKLVEESIETDVDEFRRLTKTVLATDKATEAISAGEAVLKLYRGYLMDGLYDDWIMPDRLVLEDAYTQSVVRISRAYSSLGRYDEAIACASRLSLKDPTDQTVHQLIMQLYLKAGRPSAAIRQYMELTRILTGMKSRPNELSDKLYLRAQNSVEGTPEEDEGEFTSTESTATEVSTDSRDFPLPYRPVTQFFGRDPELSLLAEKIGDRNLRLLSLTGLGGSGKTRLGLRAFDGRSDVAWLGLAEGEAGATVADEIVRQWHIQVPPEKGVEEAILNRLKVTSPAWILIDNLDHPHDADRDIIGKILAAVPQIRIMVTARQALGMDGESVIPIGPLETPEEGETDLITLAANPSVALFMHRAQAVRPDFQLSPRNVEPIVKLCRSLEGWPLALELAASWARSLSPSQMIERLGERFELLESRKKDVAERHRTIKAVLDSTWNLLDSETQTLFPMLSVFDGGTTLDAIRAIAPEVDVQNAVANLLDLGLLQIVSGPDEDLRYGLLDTVREYASNFLNADGMDVLKFRHMQYFLGRVESTYQRFDLDLPGEHLHEIGRERSNIYASLAFCEERYRPDGLKMVRCLAPYWEHQNLLAEGIDWIWRMMSGMENQTGYSQACIDVARLEFLSGMNAAAEARLKKMLQARSQTMVGSILPQIYLNLGTICHRAGRYEEEISFLTEAAKTLPKDGAVADHCRLENFLGHYYVENHDLDKAQAHYERALALARSINNPLWLAGAMLNLGNLAMMREQDDAARVLLFEAMDQSEQGHSLTIATVIMPTIARLERRTKHVSRAWMWLNRLISQAPERRDLMLECLREHVVIAVDDKRYEDAALLSGFIATVVTAAGDFENREQADYHSALLRGREANPELWDEKSMAGLALNMDRALQLIRSWPVPNRDHDDIDEPVGQMV